MNRQEALEQYYRFTQHDLEQNRKGIISENQKREALRRQQLKVIKPLIVVALVILIPSIYIGFNMMVSGNAIKIPSQVWAMFILVPAGIIGVIAFPVFKKQNFTLMAERGKVNFVRVTKKERDEDRSETHMNWNDPNRTRLSTYYEMHVGNKSFHASDKLREIVHKGDICQVYYTGSREIISMEILLQ